MKLKGIIRKVDMLGRIVLPVEIRRLLDIDVQDEIDIRVEDDRIVLTKQVSSCAFCGGTQELKSFAGKQVCRSCAEAISKL